MKSLLMLCAVLVVSGCKSPSDGCEDSVRKMMACYDVPPDDPRVQEQIGICKYGRTQQTADWAQMDKTVGTMNCDQIRGVLGHYYGG